jgi:hypothetical protein
MEFLLVILQNFLYISLSFSAAFYPERLECSGWILPIKRQNPALRTGLMSRLPLSNDLQHLINNGVSCLVAYINKYTRGCVLADFFLIFFQLFVYLFDSSRLNFR